MTSLPLGLPTSTSLTAAASVSGQIRSITGVIWPDSMRSLTSLRAWAVTLLKGQVVADGTTREVLLGVVDDVLGAEAVRLDPSGAQALQRGYRGQRRRGGCSKVRFAGLGARLSWWTAMYSAKAPWPKPYT